MFEGLFGGFAGHILAYVVMPLVGTAATAVTVWGVQGARKLGWDISKTAADQFQTAVTNAAGVVLNKAITGGLDGSALRIIALDLARKLINDNPDTAGKLGIEKQVDKVADKILDKAAGMSAVSPEPTVAVPTGFPRGGNNIPGEPYKGG